MKISFPVFEFAQTDGIDVNSNSYRIDNFHHRYLFINSLLIFNEALKVETKAESYTWIFNISADPFITKYN